jgi:hypothetical protein
MSELKDRVDKNKEKIDNILNEYREKTGENLLFSEKNFIFLDSMPFVDKSNSKETHNKN